MRNWASQSSLLRGLIVLECFTHPYPLKNEIYFTIPFEGLDHYPRVSKQKKWNSTAWFCPPPPSPSTGVGIFTPFSDIGTIAISSWAAFPLIPNHIEVAKRALFEFQKSSHLQPLAATRVAASGRKWPLGPGSHLQPLAATRSHSQPRSHSSGRKWPQVAAGGL